MKVNAIITGATGMVGEGVLHECLLHPDVETVLTISRKPFGITHPKLNEIIIKNFFDIKSIEEKLSGYNACYFCLGVSSVGKNEEEYRKLTYDLTLSFAEILSRLNPDMTFCYVSGDGTDSSEKGKTMWARVKGKTENDLMKLPFKKVYAFRPGYMQPTKGLKNTLIYYKLGSWLYPLFKLLMPSHVSTLRDLGIAMINVTLKGYDRSVIKVRDIIKLSEENT